MFQTVRDGRHFVTFPVGFREEKVGSMKEGRKEKMDRSVTERENLSRLGIAKPLSDVTANLR
jgi:hypothetical protein